MYTQESTLITRSTPLYSYTGVVPVPNSPTIPDAQYGVIQNPQYNPALDPFVFPKSSFRLPNQYRFLDVQSVVAGGATASLLIEGSGIDSHGNQSRGEVLQIKSGQTVSSVNVYSLVTSIRLLQQNGVSVTSLTITPKANRGILGPLFPDLNITGGGTATLDIIVWGIPESNMPHITVRTWMGMGVGDFTNGVDDLGARMITIGQPITAEQTQIPLNQVVVSNVFCYVQSQDTYPADFGMKMILIQQGSGY